MGFGHSPSDIAFTDDILVSLKRMPKILKVRCGSAEVGDSGERQVTGGFGTG